MQELVKVNISNEDLRPIIFKGEPVWIANRMAELGGANNPRKSISDFINSDEAISGKDYNFLQNEELQEFKQLVTSEVTSSEFKHTPQLTIFSETGLYAYYLWSKCPYGKTIRRKVAEEILPSIRKTGGYGNVESKISSDLAFKIAKEKRLLDKLNLDKAKFFSSLLEKQSPLLPPSSTQRAMSEISEILFGKKLVELPMLETKHYSLLEILKEFEKETGILLSKQKAGRVLKKYNLQVPGSGYGEFFKDKSQSSEKEVPSWKYSEMGKQRVIEILKSEFMK